jgi:thiamine kinase-like enzyme
MDPLESPKLSIQKLPDGTNHVFLMTGGDQPYVIKIPKPAAQSLIDRASEYQAGSMTAEAGINLPFYYFDVDSGVNVTVYQAHSQTLTPALLQQPLIWQAAADLLRRLHQLPQRFLHSVDIFSVIDDYKRRVADRTPSNLSDLLSWDTVLDAVRAEFSRLSLPSRPCHNDPMLTNFLLTADKRLYLIDWEYAGNHDPCWDLASFAVSAQFTPPQEKLFLDYYFQQPMTPDEQRRYEVYKVLSDYLWALWCVVMSDFSNAATRFSQFKMQLDILNHD